MRVRVLPTGTHPRSPRSSPCPRCRARRTPWLNWRASTIARRSAWFTISRPWVLRYFNIFGPRQDPASQYSAVIPLFITKALAGEGPTIDGDGEQTRDFTYVDNAVGANLLACTAEAAAVSGEVFNVGCGERISVNRLWEAIREATGMEVNSEMGPAREGDVRDSLASLDKIRGLVGYSVTVSLAEGLRRTVESLAGP